MKIIVIKIYNYKQDVNLNKKIKNQSSLATRYDLINAITFTSNNIIHIRMCGIRSAESYKHGNYASVSYLITFNYSYEISRLF